ncbi:MAG: FmdB family zinc ribbon protein, partial [Acidimicrobiales bacterium]
MPTYEYACKACGQHLEVVQSFKDAALTECQACGGTLRKVFSAIGIHFKGSGFYKTDSRSSGGLSKPAGGAKDGDAKPAAKPAETASGASGDKASAASGAS